MSSENLSLDNLSTSDSTYDDNRWDELSTASSSFEEDQTEPRSKLNMVIAKVKNLSTFSDQDHIYRHNWNDSDVLKAAKDRIQLVSESYRQVLMVRQEVQAYVFEVEAEARLMQQQLSENARNLLNSTIGSGERKSEALEATETGVFNDKFHSLIMEDLPATTNKISVWNIQNEMLEEISKEQMRRLIEPAEICQILKRESDRKYRLFGDQYSKFSLEMGHVMNLCQLSDQDDKLNWNYGPNVLIEAKNRQSELLKFYRHIIAFNQELQTQAHGNMAKLCMVNQLLSEPSQDLLQSIIGTTHDEISSTARDKISNTARDEISNTARDKINNLEQYGFWCCTAIDEKQSLLHQQSKLLNDLAREQMRRLGVSARIVYLLKNPIFGEEHLFFHRCLSKNAASKLLIEADDMKIVRKAIERLESGAVF